MVTGLFCETIDQNDNKFIEKSIRKSDEMEAGVGKTTILEGTGVWKYMANTQCNFAIKYKDELGFILSKCPIDNKQKLELSR